MLIIIILIIAALLASTFTLSACMLSSKISRREESYDKL